MNECVSLRVSLAVKKSFQDFLGYSISKYGFWINDESNYFWLIGWGQFWL